MYAVFDMESNGLLKQVTQMYCLCYTVLDENLNEIESGTLTTEQEYINFFNRGYILVGHNIIRYDTPVFRKLFPYMKIENRQIDTLGLSWYLSPELSKHGLEIWGDIFGIPKPVIEDWMNGTIEEYKYRCQEDVKINVKLFKQQMKYLIELYEGDMNQVNQLLNYLSFKLDCAREQEEVGCKIDRGAVVANLIALEYQRNERFDTLKSVMPKNIKYKNVGPPKKPLKKDGSLSATGIKWQRLLEEYGYPEDYQEEIVVFHKEEEPNPGSPSQIKDWLFSLGWDPLEYKESISKVTGEIKQVPQIYNDDKEVCDSIKVLYNQVPELEALNALSLIKHRVGVFQGFLDCMDEENYVTAEVAGFTNTLRFKHAKPIANLPGVRKFYGKEIRGVIISPDKEHVLLGSDMSSLEDTTKQHYMYFFDPEYVKQMRVKGFDPHVDVAVLASMMTKEEEDFYKSFKAKSDEELAVTPQEEKDKFYSLDGIRSLAKVVNFSGVYGAGPPKISKATGLPLPKAQELHKTYWLRNKAVKDVANAVRIKTLVNPAGVEQMWLYNPVSTFWYSLRFKKDIFSTLNQSSGVFCFDSWVRQLRLRQVKIALQYHDEVAVPVLKGQEEQYKAKFLESIEEVNNQVKLNVPLGVSIDFGQRYSDIH